MARQLRLDERGQRLIDTVFVVLDLETTGSRPDSDRITEIGAVKVRGGLPMGTFATLVDPGVPIPPTITTLTGISDRDVAGHPPIGGLLPALLEFLGDAVLVAHSARFDVSFLNAALARADRPPLANTVVDTVALARRLVRDEVRNLKLSTLASHLRARTQPTHRALSDARATVDVLHALLERAGAIGATTLPDLLDLCRARSMPAFRRIGLVDDAPSAAGTYRFLDGDGRVLYVGKATDLRARLRQYFGQDPRRRMAEMVRRTERVVWTTTPTLIEAEVREVRAIHQWQPAYNRRSRHPQRRVWVALSDEPFPRVVVSSSASAAGRALLGPVDRRTAADLQAVLVEVGGLRDCSTRLRVRQDHPPCVLKDLGRCGAPCDGSQSREDYAALVDGLRGIVDGAAGIVRSLDDAMQEASAAHLFERAARLRDQTEVLATAVWERRRLAALRATERLVAAAPAAGRGWDVIVVDSGRLVASEHQRSDVPVLPQALPVPLPEPTAEGGDGVAGLGDDAMQELQTFEERRLVARWLEQRTTRLLWAEPGLASPWRGGAVVAAIAARRRAAGGQRRLDVQAVAGAGARARAGGPGQAAMTA